MYVRPSKVHSRLTAGGGSGVSWEGGRCMLDQLRCTVGSLQEVGLGSAGGGGREVLSPLYPPLRLAEIYFK